MGYGDISALNSESKIQTPVLDRLINEGRNFKEAHSSAALCTPTRYGLLTGRYNFRTGLSGVATGYSPPMIEYERETIASLLKKAGYNTAIIGKWHLGLEWQAKDPSRPIFSRDAFIPDDLNVDYTKGALGVNEIGFDYSFISPAGNNLAPFCFIENGMVTELPTEYFQPQVTGFHANNFATRRNGGDKAPNYDLETTLEELTNKAVNYLKNPEIKDRPFFLYLSLTAPHFPWVAQKGFLNKSDAGPYGDFITEMDYRIGVILGALKSQGLDDNTLVIFTADNGASTPEGFLAKYRHEMNKGRRGQKSEIWEGGVRVPFVARWHGVIPSGSSTSSPLSLVDLIASFATIANVPLNDRYAEDSYDLSSILLGIDQSPVSRGPMINQSGAVRGISITHDQWKLIPYGYGRQGLDPAPPGKPEGQLYNLAVDSLETNNVYRQNPEIVKQLSATLEQYKEQGFSRPDFNKQ